jgi:hypothetical protein
MSKAAGFAFELEGRQSARSVSGGEWQNATDLAGLTIIMRAKRGRTHGDELANAIGSLGRCLAANASALLVKRHGHSI